MRVDVGTILVARAAKQIPVRPRAAGPLAAIAIWRDAWMPIARSTFTGDLVHPLGRRSVFDDAG